MKNLSIAIIEDENEHLAMVKSFIERYGLEKGVEFHIDTFNYAEIFLEKYKPIYDIVFMDIGLPGMDGMEAARRLRQHDQNVLLFFLTNMSEFAIKGYEVNAMDYILKPATYFSLAMRLTNALKRLDASDDVTIPVRLADGVCVLRIQDLYFIDIMKHDVVYHTVDGCLTSYGTLNELEKRLVPFGFARCSAAALVNLRYIKSIFGNEISIGGEAVHISRGKKKEFITAFNDYLGRRW